MNKLLSLFMLCIVFGWRFQVDPDPLLPKKENFWIFILAGQSNMAGRGLLEPEDTIPDPRIFTLDVSDHWVQAKEPLHYYEPGRTGLDCGLSFGKDMIRQLDTSIYIGLIPCAVGGSSVEQWLGDSTHRGVTLFSNLRHKAELAEKVGTIKGIIWHQGENNANPTLIKDYENKVLELFHQFRSAVHNDHLQIMVGELANFLSKNEYGHYPDTINRILHHLPVRDPFISVIPTADLIHKGDSVHFDGPSQRVLGRRFAAAVKL